MGYSKAWSSGAYRQLPIASPRNPAHLTPSDHDVGRNWQHAPQAPALMPTDTIDSGAFTLDSAAGGLPWTPPGHNDGVGYGAGLSFAASAAVNDAAHARNDGSVESRTWAPMGERDGAYHVDRMQLDVDVDAIGSPGWVAHQRQLDRTYYPNRRTGHRIQRYRDRVFLRRTWGVQFRPIVTPNAYTAPPLTNLDTRSKYVSPYADSATRAVRTVQTTAPQTRRSPAPWDESITKDGAASSIAHDPAFVAWGL